MGRAQLLAHERRALQGIRSLRAACVRPWLVNGDHVVIRWVFAFEALDGRRMRLEELAYQRWEGERIVAEQFFYDPAQLQAAPA
nr:hypothetical protein [Inhella proteolytica]